MIFYSSNLNFDYSESLYKSMESKLSTIIRPIVVEISKSKNGNIDNFGESPGDEQNVANKLFQLYLRVKELADIGLSFRDVEEFQITEYFKWFSNGIDKWSDTSVFSAFSR